MRSNVTIAEELVRSDAAIRLGVSEEEITVSRHEQVFGSTSCGFPGLGGAAMTRAEVVVAEAASGGACVYVTGRLCYLVAEPNEEFADALTEKNLMPAHDYRGQYDRRPQPAAELFAVKGSKRAPTDFKQALEQAYDRARPGYGIKREAKPATVVRVSDDTIVCQLTPVENGTRSPEYVFTPESNAYRFGWRFPHIGEHPGLSGVEQGGEINEPSGLSFD